MHNKLSIRPGILPGEKSEIKNVEGKYCSEGTNHG